MLLLRCFVIILVRFQEISMRIVKIILSIGRCHKSIEALLVYCYRRKTLTWMTHFGVCLLEGEQWTKKIVHIVFIIKCEKKRRATIQKGPQFKMVNYICIYMKIKIITDSGMGFVWVFNFAPFEMVLFSTCWFQRCFYAGIDLVTNWIYSER